MRLTHRLLRLCAAAALLGVTTLSTACSDALGPSSAGRANAVSAMQPALGKSPSGNTGTTGGTSGGTSGTGTNTSGTNTSGPTSGTPGTPGTPPGGNNGPGGRQPSSGYNVTAF